MRASDVRRCERPEATISPRRALAALGALLLIPLLCGGSCSVAARYCSDDCDPCWESCGCSDVPCTHPLSAGGLPLDGEPAAIELREDGTLVRTIGPLVGWSAAASARGRGFERPDLVRYADALVRSNPSLFGEARGWALAPLESLRDGHLVVLERADALATFFFDRSGAVTWIEIQRATRGG